MENKTYVHIIFIMLSLSNVKDRQSLINSLNGDSVKQMSEIN